MPKGDLVTCQCLSKWGECSPDCLGEFIQKSIQPTLYCRYCSVLNKKLLRRKWGQEQRDTPPKVKCKCPRCEKEYEKHLTVGLSGNSTKIVRWIGNGIPRVYCKICEGTVNSGFHEYPEPHEVSRKILGQPIDTWEPLDIGGEDDSPDNDLNERERHAQKQSTVVWK